MSELKSVPKDVHSELAAPIWISSLFFHKILFNVTHVVRNFAFIERTIFQCLNGSCNTKVIWNGGVLTIFIPISEKNVA